MGPGGVERALPQPVAFVGVVIGTVGEGHAVKQMAMVVMMPPVVMMVMVAVPVSVMVVMAVVTLVHPLREPFNRQ